MSLHPLERLLAPVQPVALDDPPYSAASQQDLAIRCGAGPGAPRWLQRDGWRVLASVGASPSGGEAIAAFQAEQGELVQVRARRGHRVEIPFSLGQAYENYVMERWVARARQRRLPPAALSAFYLAKRAIPRPLQLTVRRALMRWQGAPEFPRWPFDASVSRLLRLYARCQLEALGAERIAFRWFWPEGSWAALILTHDVESAAGLRNAIAVADCEQERGLRSSFNVVGDWYPIDWGVVEELRARGFELGVHGLFHDRSLFRDRAEFERQLPLLRAFGARLGAEGFRSPSTHRVSEWLGELPASYDCTMPLSDPYEPQPGGCCSPWPYFIGDVVELPYTLPQDHTLFTLKRERGIHIWAEQLAAIESAGGLAQCVTHPDPGYLGERENLRRYSEFLDLVKTRERLWRVLPREVAAWWRKRDSPSEALPEDRLGHAVLEDGPLLAGFEPPPDGRYPAPR